MKSSHRLMLALCVLLLPVRMPADTPAHGGCLRIKSKCKLQIKQTKFGFQFGGVEFRSGQASKVGSVSINTDLLQKLSDIAQILDQMQFSRCQLLSSMTSCDSAREFALTVAAVGNEQLGQLAILAQMNSDDSSKLQDALLKWIIQSGDVISKIYSKQFMAADSTVKNNSEKAQSAVEFAAKELKISSESREFQEVLRDNPIRSRLQ